MLLQGDNAGKSVGESLRALDDGDILAARLESSYLSLRSVDPSVELVLNGHRHIQKLHGGAA